MKKLAFLIAAFAAVNLVGFGAPVFADSPGQLSNGDNNYKVRNVTQNGAYGKSVALACNETVKYSITLANSDFGQLRDVTVRASLPNSISASAVNANNETTSVSGSVNVTVANGATLTYVAGSTQKFTSAGQLVATLSDGITTGGVNTGTLGGSTQEFIQFQAKAVCAPAPTKIQVCELATKKVITINESDFDQTKHSKNLADCATAPQPGEITVCEIATKKIVNIKENAFDQTKYTKDLSKCASTPVTPVTPAELPATGAESTMLIAGGFLSVLAAAAFYVAQTRRNILG